RAVVRSRMIVMSACSCCVCSSRSTCLGSWATISERVDCRCVGERRSVTRKDTAAYHGEWRYSARSNSNNERRAGGGRRWRAMAKLQRWTSQQERKGAERKKVTNKKHAYHSTFTGFRGGRPLAHTHTQGDNHFMVCGCVWCRPKAGPQRSARSGQARF